MSQQLPRQLALDLTIDFIQQELVERAHELQQRMAHNDASAFDLNLELFRLDALTTYLESCPPDYRRKYMLSQ